MTIYAEIEAPTATVKRDRYGRPLIEGKPWQRATTFASQIADKAGLIPWAQEMTARGLAQRPDLLATVAANLDDKSAVRRAAEDAKEHGGGSSAATLGTALHRMTELADLGRHLPDLHADRIAQYQDCLARHGIEILPSWIETMVLHERYGVAGTPDRVVRWGDRWVILDLKTGADLRYAIGEIAIQLHTYASADAGYDPATESRLALPDIDQDVALVVHLPAQGDGCELIEVDIAAGREAAEHCLWVREWRKRRDLMRPVEITETEAVAAVVEASPGSTVSKRDPDRIARSVARIQAAPTPDPFTPPDEGADLDLAATRAWVTAGIARLSRADDHAAEVGQRVHAWALDGQRHQRPWAITAQTCTERRKAIHRAAARLAAMTPDDTEALEFLTAALPDLDIQPATTVGMALGTLTIADAAHLTDQLTAIDEHRTAITIDDSGRPHLRAV